MNNEYSYINTIPKSFLVTFWVTSDCNLNCKYCYEGNDKKIVYMNDEVIKKAVGFTLQKAKSLKCGCLDVHFHGGEPLLALDRIQKIFNLIEMDKPDDLRINYTITTNATLIDDTNIEFLSKNIDDISFSIDGIKESHDKNRIFLTGSGTHDIVTQNCKWILKHRNIKARMTITSNNVNFLYESIIFLINLGFETIVTGIDYIDRNWDESKIEILRVELEKVKRYMDELFEKQNKPIKVSLVNDIRFRKKGKCTGGINTIHIDPSGNIFPCSYIVGQNDYICGSVFTGMDNAKLYQIHKENEEEIDECNGCTYYDYCLSKRCKLINKCITGSYSKPSPIICAIENLKLHMVNI